MSREDAREYHQAFKKECNEPLATKPYELGWGPSANRTKVEGEKAREMGVKVGAWSGSGTGLVRRQAPWQADGATTPCWLLTHACKRRASEGSELIDFVKFPGHFLRPQDTVDDIGEWDVA